MNKNETFIVDGVQLLRIIANKDKDKQSAENALDLFIGHFYPLINANVEIQASKLGYNRVGKDNKKFKMCKFRSMRVARGANEASLRPDQDRIFWWGKIMRRLKIDELPQLINILNGTMSILGPRPDVPGYADKLTGDDRDVLKLRPGITGPATLKYRLEDEMISDYVAKRQAEGAKC